MNGNQLAHSSQSAPISEFRVMWTAQKRQKLKKWHDGTLRFHTFNNRMLLYDEARSLITDKYLKPGNKIEEGDEIEFEQHLATVEEFLQTIIQDLTPLFARPQQRAAAAAAAMSPQRTSTPRAANSPAVNTPHPAIPRRQMHNSPPQTRTPVSINPHSNQLQLQQQRPAYPQAVTPAPANRVFSPLPPPPNFQRQQPPPPPRSRPPPPPPQFRPPSQQISRPQRIPRLPQPEAPARNIAPPASPRPAPLPPPRLSPPRPQPQPQRIPTRPPPPPQETRQPPFSPVQLPVRNAPPPRAQHPPISRHGPVQDALPPPSASPLKTPSPAITRQKLQPPPPPISRSPSPQPPDLPPPEPTPPRPSPSPEPPKARSPEPGILRLSNPYQKRRKLLAPRGPVPEPTPPAPPPPPPPKPANKRQRKEKAQPTPQKKRQRIEPESQPEETDYGSDSDPFEVMPTPPLRQPLQEPASKPVVFKEQPQSRLRKKLPPKQSQQQQVLPTPVQVPASPERSRTPQRPATQSSVLIPATQEPPPPPPKTTAASALDKFRFCNAKEKAPITTPAQLAQQRQAERPGYAATGAWSSEAEYLFAWKPAGMR